MLDWTPPLTRDSPLDGRFERGQLAMLRSLRGASAIDADLGVLIAAIERDGFAFVRFV
jgi:hypothetical protein